MTQAELQRTLRLADPSAVLVSPRILEGVIREEHRLPNLHWNIPHWKSFVCDRQRLFRHAEQADLDLEPDQLLPDTVILIVRPDAEELSNLERRPLLLKYWRRLFHARIHLALEVRRETGALDDQAVAARIEAIGRSEFAEITDVLSQDGYLPPQPTPLQSYIEFAAVYLELRSFAASLLASYFPGLSDTSAIDRLLAADVDTALLFRQTRLADAPDPVAPVESRSDESQEAYWHLVRLAQKASMENNTVEAAILRLRASRIAPAVLTVPTRREAEEDVTRLCQRLATALAMNEGERLDWTRHLIYLLEKADQGTFPVEVRILHDLQDVCEDHEHEIYTLDLVEFLLSGGKRPIKRPLPSQRLVRIVKHLRLAQSRLSEVRLSEADRGHLGRLIQLELSRAEEALRRRFRPVLVTAMQDVGLQPVDPVEQAAFDKMVDELLDRISGYGYLTATELRDTISRNQLKLPDLTDPEHFLRGDPFVRLDRRLGMLLDGVYRPSDCYIRWLERGTSLLFGTNWGRPLTLYLLLPLFLAWLTMHVVGMFLLKGVSWTAGHDEAPLLTAFGQVLQGPTHDDVKLPGLPHQLAWHLLALGGLTLFTGALLHSERLRRRLARGLRTVWRAGYWTLVQVPLRFVPLATLRRFVNGWAFQLLYWYLLKPLLFTLLLLLVIPYLRYNGTAAILAFLLAGLVVNSRPGRAFSEATLDGLVSLVNLVRAGLLPGLFRLITRAFKQVLETLDYLMIQVEEWLRYRSGDGRLSLVARTVAGVLWFPIAFLARFYMVVLIEPTINPLKFPVASVAYKVLFPVLYLSPLRGNLTELLAPFVGHYLALTFVEVTVFLLPDSVAFLVWEMRENWSLYRVNRGANLRPVPVGNHGETFRGLLHPGFHSGTIPRAYSRLRRAERRALRAGNWSPARAYRHELEELTAALHRFHAREMVALLRLSCAWQGQGIDAGPVRLSNNRIALEVIHHQHPARPVQIEIEHHHGWLVAGLRSPGWLEQITAEQRHAFAACLAYLYKLAAVDLVREQVTAELPGPVRSLQLTEHDLWVWQGDEVTPTRYPLQDWLDDLPEGKQVRRMLFSRHPLPWDEWVAFWRADQAGTAVDTPHLARLVRQCLPVLEKIAPPTTVPSLPRVSAAPVEHG